jgi:hypothetical protein
MVLSRRAHRLPIFSQRGLNMILGLFLVLYFTNDNNFKRFS